VPASLKLGRGERRIACVLPSAIPHFQRVLRGVLSVQKEEPRLAVNVLHPVDKALAEIHRYDGLIAAVFDAAEEKRLLATGRPVLNISNAPPAGGLPRVVNDDLATGTLAATHLVEQGYRHLAYAAPVRVAEFSRLRRAGVLAVVRRLGLDLLTLAIAQPAEADPFVLRAALQRLPQPCGIVAENDGVAGLLMECAQAAGLPVPATLGIVGVDNLSGGPWAFPWDVTSVELNAEAIGVIAARQMCRRLLGQQRRLTGELVPPLGLRVRSSSTADHVSDPLVARALAMLRADTRAELNGARLAAALHTSRENLQRHFRAALGVTPKAEIARRRLQLAKELLTETELSIGLVAERCGQAKQSTFCSRFRQATGLTPTAYRQQYQVRPDLHDRQR
jgi:LacI family transcriptional regulator